MDYQKIRLGAIPSKPDVRDYRVSMFTPVQSRFDQEFILSHTPGIYNQGIYGQCVAFSIAGLKESHEWKEWGTQIRYSSGFIYANRKSGDYTGEGMYPREALKSLVTDGVPPFNEFDIVNDYPTCYRELQPIRDKLLISSRPQKIQNYVAIYSSDEVKTALTSWGPVLLVIGVYTSFYVTGSNGIVRDVGLSESLHGYHAMIIVGWTTINGQPYWVVNNSWGTNWGKGGICYIPIGYKGISEMWSVTDSIMPKRNIQMDVPVQIIPPGHTMVPFRHVYTPLGASIEWGRRPDNQKIWAKAIVPPSTKTRIVIFEQDSSIITVSE